MSGTHGDLFSEIGKMVLAAHAGQSIDLKAKSEDLARRYMNLGVPAETIARAIARSLGAVSLSMAIVRAPDIAAADGAGNHVSAAPADGLGDGGDADEADEGARSPSALFPSGVRLALLS